METHYTTLGVEATASEADVRQAYKTKCRLLHPDKNADRQSTLAFQRLQEAYETLRDQTKRCGYDTQLWLQGLGVDPDERQVEWIVNARSSNATVIDVKVETRLLEPSPFAQLRQNSGADFLYLRIRNNQHQSVVFIKGSEQMVETGKQLLLKHRDEAFGLAAPAHGLVFIVPNEMMSRVPLIQSNLPALSSKHGVQISPKSQDRFAVLGSLKSASKVAAQLQRWTGFKGTILLPGGEELDAWQYEHYCEMSDLNLLQDLQASVTPGPDQEPDSGQVRRLFAFACAKKVTAEENECLTVLAVAVLSLNRLTTPLKRALVSQALCAEWSGLPSKDKAPLICAIASTQHQLIHRSEYEAMLKGFKSLGEFLTGQQGLLLRARGYVSMKEAVPADSQWHGWFEVLITGKLSTFWLQCLEIVRLPQDWHAVPQVMGLVLQHCSGPDMAVDTTKGLRHEQAPSTAEADNDHPKTKTAVEDVEDCLFEMSRAIAHSGGVSVHSLSSRCGQSLEQCNKIVENHKLSFQADQTGIRLSQSGKARAAMRESERSSKDKRKLEHRIAMFASQKLQQLPLQLPHTFRLAELCGLMICLEKQTHWELAAVAFKRLVAPEPGKIRSAIVPFQISHVMKSVINYEKAGKKIYDEKESLVAVLKAASLSMLRNESSSYVSLDVATECLVSATQKPFVGVMDMTEPQMILTSAASRVAAEIAEDDNPEICPACFSRSYSSFFDFAKLCASLAYFYSLVWQKMLIEYSEQVVQVFEILAAAVEKFYEFISSEQNGLRQMVRAFELIGSVKDARLERASSMGLRGLSRLLEISKLDLWDFENLAAVVNGFKLPHPNVKMFEKIGKAAARVVKAMAKVSVDQMVHFIATYGQLGILHHLEKLLKQLRDKNWFKTLIAPWNIAKIDEEQILPHVLAAMVRAQEFDVLQEIAEKYKNKDISTQKIVAILTGLSGCEDKLTIKSAFLKKLVDLCRTCPPEIKDMEQIVYVCQKDAGSLNTLIEICHHRNILESIPKQWQELTRCLECLLGPFTDAKLRVPLLEAAFASRLMQALAQCSKPEPEEVVAAGLKFSVEALASMPALAHAIILRIKSLPKRSELERFKTFISNIALSAKHVPTEAGTAELDAWTAAIDKVILEEASNLGTSRSDLSWSLVEMMTMSSNNLPMKIRQELGQAWLSTILARSRRVFWDGLRVLLEPPRPTEALRAMKQELQGHHPETQSPDAKLSDEVTTEQPVQALTTTCSPTSSPTSAPTSVQESAPASAKQSPEPSRPEIERPRSRSRSRSHAPEAALTVSCQNPKFRGSYRRKGTRNGKAAFAKIDDEEVQLFTEKTCWCLGSPTSGWIRHPSNSGGFAPTEGWDDPTLRISWHAPRVTHGSVAAPRAKVANKKPRTGDRVLKGTPMPLVGEPSPSPSPVEQATLVTPQGELKQWLRSASVDGILMQYEERLVDQLDGDMTFLPEFVCEANSEKVGLARIDPAFWEAIQCTKLAHKLQFSKAMIKLKDAPLA